MIQNLSARLQTLFVLKSTMINRLSIDQLAAAGRIISRLRGTGFSDDDAGQRVPRILQCGHSACQNCYAKMLAKMPPQRNAKPLPCPECREVTEVERGRADSLPKIFLLLR